MLRFNHMEITVPEGHLDEHREEIKEFYGDLFGFESLDVPLMGRLGLLLRTDPETSQFLLVMEHRNHLANPGFDHLGFLCESRGAVDACLEKCKARQQRDDRVELKEYDDLVIGGVTTHAFYVRFLLPLWFDVQVLEYDDGAAPTRAWQFLER